MGQIPPGSYAPGSYAWHDEDDALEIQLPADPGMAGLPETWRHYEWKAAAVLLAALGLFGALIPGPSPWVTTSMDRAARDVWSLLAVLAICAGLLRNRRRTGMNFPLCVLIAVAAHLAPAL
ncbi:hypothetical protein [Microvirga sp. TS319]|uniref:hypothetical protein n=1 Tax=Microvirga sp. TS319 TaxID=3241165 RepID=UPI00351A3297